MIGTKKNTKSFIKSVSQFSVLFNRLSNSQQTLNSTWQARNCSEILIDVLMQVFFKQTKVDEIIRKRQTY